MAKKQKDETVKQKDETVKQTDGTGETAGNTAENPPEGNVFEAVGVSIKLRITHPHDSYGRAGYRFGKSEPVEIDLDALTDEQLDALNDDPWLEITYLTDK